MFFNLLDTPCARIQDILTNFSDSNKKNPIVSSAMTSHSLAC